MNLKLLKLLLLMLALNSGNALSRSPAVENFFELNHESMNKHRVPSDVNTGFEFKKVQNVPKINRKVSNLNKANEAGTGFAITTLIGLFALFALPFSTHLALSILNKNKALKASNEASEIILKYKSAAKEQEVVSQDDDIKKAS